VYVAASTLCYASLPLEGALKNLADLEFSKVEVAVSESGNHLKPSEIVARFDACLHRIRDASPLMPVAFNVRLEGAGDSTEQQFQAVCRLAKQALVTSVTVQASRVGTPFNTEIERLRRFQGIAAGEGLLLSITTEADRLTQDPDTAVELCQAVPGLGLTLDPSHYIYGPHQGASFDQVFPHVYHVHLRDTRRDRFQTRVGQGEIEYGRLVTQLARYDYRRALSVELLELPEDDFNREAELRKLRLLLESLV
jgi:sugar phosphate isomerase/epimerase